MKKLLACLTAVAFLAASGVTIAKEESKKDEMKKSDKSASTASKDGKTAKAPKKKKEGC